MSASFVVEKLEETVLVVVSCLLDFDVWKERSSYLVEIKALSDMARSGGVTWSGTIENVKVNHCSWHRSMRHFGIEIYHAYDGRTCIGEDNTGRRVAGAGTRAAAARRPAADSELRRAGRSTAYS